MPNIPQTTGISTRVPGTQVSGGSATGQALAQLGGNMAQIGSQLYQKQRELETRNYVDETEINLNRDRQQWISENSKMINGDGTLGETGMAYGDALKQWEDSQLDIIKENSPNSHSFNEFKRKNASTRHQNILKGDLDQINAVRAAGIRLDEQRVENATKQLVSSEGDILDEGFRAIEDNTNAIAGHTDTLYSREEAVVKAAQGNNRIAKSVLENLLDRGDHQTAMAQLKGFINESPEASQIIQKEMDSLLANSLPAGRTLDQVMIGEDGYSRLEVDGEKVVFEPGQAEWIAESEWEGPIEVEGRRSLEDFLSPEEKLSYIRKFSRQVKEKSAESKQDIRSRHNDLKASFSSRIAKGGLDIDSMIGENAFVDHVARIRRNYDENTGNAMISDLLITASVSDMGSELALMNHMDAGEAIESLPDKVLELGISRGLLPPALANDEVFMAAAMDQAQGRLSQMYQRMDKARREDPGGFFAANDARFAKLSSKKYESGQAWDNYQDALSARQEMLGIPLSERKYLSEGELSLEAQTLSDALHQNDTESLALASDWVIQNRERWGDKFEHIVKQMQGKGIEPSQVLAASISIEGQGPRVMNKIWQNSRHYKQNLEELRRRNPEMSKRALQSVAQERVAPLMESVLASATNLDEYHSNMEGFRAMIEGELASVAVNRGIDSVKELEPLADQIGKDFIDANWSQVSSGDTSFLMGNDFFQQHDTTPRQLGRAVETAMGTDRLMEHIDWSKSFPLMGLPDNISDRAMRTMVSGGGFGQIIPVPSAEGITLSTMLPDGRKVPLVAKEGKQSFITFDEILTIPAEERDIAREERATARREERERVRQRQRDTSERARARFGGNR